MEKPYCWETPPYRVAIITSRMYNAESSTHVCRLRGLPSKWKNRDGRRYFIVLPVGVEHWLNTQWRGQAICNHHHFST